MRIIKRWQAGVDVRFADRDLEAAFFLHKHPGWRPEDLGYPRGDYILFDLMREMTNG